MNRIAGNDGRRMHIGKIVAAFVLATGLLAGFGSALAADGDATAANLDKLQEQFRVLDKDVSVLKEVSASKLDAQDKRISDIGLATAQQGNHLSAISNQTAAVGNYIAWTSGVITLFVFIAGFATYFSAKTRAEKEARDASANWFKEHSNELRMEIEKIRELARQTKESFSQAGNEVAASAIEVRETIKKH